MSPRVDMPVLRQLPYDPLRGTLRERMTRWFVPVVYEVVENYRYETVIRGEPTTLLLPAGFRTDLATTPRLTWIFGCRPDGVLLIPGLFHDFFYRHGFVLGRQVGCIYRRIFGDRRFGDRLLLQLAREMSGTRLIPHFAYIALRLCGWPAWVENDGYRWSARETRKLQLKGDYQDYDDAPGVVG